MAPHPNHPPTGRTERKYLLVALAIVVAASVIYFATRMLGPDPAPEIDHGGPSVEHGAPPTEEPELPEDRGVVD
jgi:hypothetical protein